MDEKRIAPCPLNRCEYDLIGKKNHLWRVIPSEKTEYATLFNPAYWSLVAANFEQYDEIKVVAEDGSYYARLLVKDCNKTSAKVSEIFFKELDKLPQDSLDLGDFAIVYKGPVLKHCVLRKADGKIIEQGIKFKTQAIKWLEDYKKAA